MTSKLMTMLKKEPFTASNGDEWNVFKLDGRFGPVWAVGRADDEEGWQLPFFATRAKAKAEIELV